MDTAIRTSALAPLRPVAASPGWLLLAANVALLIGALLFLFIVPADVSTLRLGQVAGETVLARRQVSFHDPLATAALRKRAMAAVPTVFNFDSSAAERRRGQATTFLQNLAQIIISGSSTSTRTAAIRALLPSDIPPSALEGLPPLNAGDFRVVQERTLNLLSQAEAWRFDARQKQPTALALLSTIPPHVTLPQRTAIGAVFMAFLAPTLIADNVATRNLRLAAAAKVHEVTTTIYPGQAIVRRGDLVTPLVMEQITALGLRNRQKDWHEVLASALFAVIIVAMLFWYLHAFHGVVLTDARLLFFMDICIVVTVAAARLLTGGHILLPYFLPVAAASTFAAILISPEACIAVTLAIALLAGWVVGNSFELAVYYFVTGAAGTLAIRNVRQLKEFIIAGLFITVFALATMLTFGLIDHVYDLSAIRDYMLAAGGNGFLASTLALGGFALLSSFFGVTTTLQWLELAHPNQILLRRLTVKAPGTYNHSLIVSNMVERAAEEVGANALVAKVSALYHDVGKTANPHCFVENQLGMANVHDELTAAESARIIRGHVTQGLRLARQGKLPRPVLDAIAQHHGTTTLVYFLHKAQREQNGAPIDTSLYTYPGPKPQTKETALLMLADGCESAVRAAKDRSYDSIRDTVGTIFRERMDGGQLDECPLTMKDLERTQAAFCSVLNGLYHPRIDYPEPAAAETAVEAPLLPRTPVQTRSGGHA